MYLYEEQGVHKEMDKPFTLQFQAFPVDRPYWKQLLHWRPWKRWFVECIVEFDEPFGRYHHYVHDFYARSLRTAIQKAQERGDEVWMEVYNSPRAEWWL